MGAEQSVFRTIVRPSKFEGYQSRAALHHEYVSQLYPCSTAAELCVSSYDSSSPLKETLHDQRQTHCRRVARLQRGKDAGSDGPGIARPGRYPHSGRRPQFRPAPSKSRTVSACSFSSTTATTATAAISRPAIAKLWPPAPMSSSWSIPIISTRRCWSPPWPAWSPTAFTTWFSARASSAARRCAAACRSINTSPTGC